MSEDNEKFSGRVSDSAEIQSDPTINNIYRAEIEQTIEIQSFSGEEKKPKYNSDSLTRKMGRVITKPIATTANDGVHCVLPKKHHMNKLIITGRLTRDAKLRYR